MFDSLSDRLSSIFDKLKGRGALSEADVVEALRDVRRALIEADVALDVVRSFTDKVQERAIGAQVVRSVNPGQMVVKIVHDVMVETLGSENQSISLESTPPVAIMMVGLQGSGKTTTSAKIAKRFFDLDPRVLWFTEDGLTFPDRCGVTYDAIVVDACTGQGTVPGFTRSDWLSGVMNTCTESGVLMLNLAYNLVNEGSVAIDGFALSEEMSRLGFHSVLLRPEDGWEGNELLILSRTQPTINLRTPEILDRPTEARSYLLSLRAHVKRARS